MKKIKFLFFSEIFVFGQFGASRGSFGNSDNAVGSNRLDSLQDIQNLEDFGFFRGLRPYKMNEVSFRTDVSGNDKATVSYLTLNDLD